MYFNPIEWEWFVQSEDVNYPLWRLITNRNFTRCKSVQLACKILSRLNKDITVGAFIALNPNDFRGYYGVGDIMAQELKYVHNALKLVVNNEEPF